jgi:hypothetical protein
MMTDFDSSVFDKAKIEEVLKEETLQSLLDFTASIWTLMMHKSLFNFDLDVYFNPLGLELMRK